MRNEKYAIWPLVMAELPKLLHSSAMDFWTRLWGRYHVPQNVFLVLTYVLSAINRRKLVKGRHFAYLLTYMLTYVLYINDRYKSVKVVFLHICLNPDCERSTPVSKKVIFLHTYLLPVFERSTQIGKKSSFYILTYMLTYVVYANDRYKSVNVIFLHICLYPDCERSTPVSKKLIFFTYLPTSRLQTIDTNL